MRYMAILADDLTGASDSGVQFARKGLSTQVIFHLQQFEQATEGVDTVVLDSDSRSVSASEAYRRVSQAALLLNETRFSHIYKKLDSTLRGNLGAEIDAVMDVMAFPIAVVAPAFPKIGRTTVNGTHFLNGVPIHQTEIARDPKCPVAESDICQLLAAQSKRKSALISLETLRAGAEAVLDVVECKRTDGVQLFVFDAETDDDLARIAEIMTNDRYRVLWVGSAGLADMLPATLGIPIRDYEAQPVAKTDKPTMLVAGSISRITREQVATYCEQPQVVSVELNPLPVVEGRDAWEQETARCRTLLKNALTNGQDVAFYAGASPEQVQAAKALGAQIGLDDNAISNGIAEAIGTVAAQVVQVHELQGIILTGGDTAKAVCRQLGVSGISLLKELEPGIPLSRLVGGQELLTVTKAGAFGTKDSLVHALQVLKGDSDHE
jgi:D-threonate/D-erythronate kinase